MTRRRKRIVYSGGPVVLSFLASCCSWRGSSARQGATTKELMRRLGHATADMAMRYQRAETNRDRALAKAVSDDVLNRRTSDA